LAFLDFLKRKPTTNLSLGSKSISVGRKTVDALTSTITASNIFTYVPRQFKEYHKYDLTQLSKLDSQDIIRLLVYVEPTVSHAVSNYLRVFDSGYFLTARKPNGKVHAQGQAFLDELVDRLNHPNQEGFSFDQSLPNFYLQCASSVLLDGAVSAEMPFDENYKVMGLYPVDPLTIDFKWNGERSYPVQGSGFSETSLDYRNFFYIPVDPIAGDPYGTNQVLAAIQAVMNKLRLLQDFSRALRNLGFDRIDVSIDQEKILKATKQQGITQPDKLIEYINGVITEAKTSMENLGVDDNPVHLDTLTLNALGGKNIQSGINLQAIVDVLMSDIASAMKSYATILGKRFGGSTEGYTSIEALLFIQLIIGFQSIVERLLERMFTLALQVEAGIQAFADWEWYEPSLRPIYESSQYFSAYSLMLWEEEQLGAISEDERNRKVRRMLKLKGDPPSDAVRDPDFSPSGGNTGTGTPTPQRDVSQEGDKEKKRKDSNRDRRSTGG
jgi:hypothetical protein